MNLYNQTKTTRQISEEGIALLIQSEGYSATAYLDSANIPTIGYGSLYIEGRKVRIGDHITREQAEQQLYLDLFTFESAVNQLVTVYITQSQYDSVVNLIYNIGITAFEESTLLRLLNDGRYEQAAAQFDRWHYAGGKVNQGLINRRARERELFERDI